MRVPESGSVAWFNGGRTTAGAVSWPGADPLTVHGLGCFETLSIRDGAVLDLDRHIDRLTSTVKRWGWRAAPPAGTTASSVDSSAVSSAVSFGGPRAAILDVAAWLASASRGGKAGWIRWSHSASGRWSVVGGVLEDDGYGAPLHWRTLPWRRDHRQLLAGCKPTAYAEHALARDWAVSQGADDGLWLNQRGHLVEATTANLFVIERGKVFAPACGDGCLPGIVRARLLEVLRSRGFTLHEGRVRTARIGSCDEVWATSSLGGLRPVASLDGRPLPTPKDSPRPVIAEALERARIRTPAQPWSGTEA